MLTGLLRAIRGNGLTGDFRAYDLGNGAAVALTLLTWRRIGASMDQMAKALRYEG
jgi:hypothetical protein